MKKLTFKVDMQNKQDIIALTKEVNNDFNKIKG